MIDFGLTFHIPEFREAKLKLKIFSEVYLLVSTVDRVSHALIYYFWLIYWLAASHCAFELRIKLARQSCNELKHTSLTDQK